jgi:uncharacterized membrane protein
MPESSHPNPPLEQTRPTRAQRRRAVRKQRQNAIPRGAEGRSAYLQRLIRRAYPSYEFFLFAALSGAILGLGYLLDSQAVLVFGILMAPLLTPLMGMILATVSGSGKYFLQATGAFFIGGLFIFLTGALAGFVVRLWLPLTLEQAFVHSRLWWTDLVVLALGAILLAASFVRSEKKPFLPSVMVADELFYQLNAAAFGLTSGVGDIFPQGVFVFVAHLAWALLFGIVTLFFLGFRPAKKSGWLFSLLTVAVLLGIVITLLLPKAEEKPTGATQPTSTRAAEMPESETEVSVAEMRNTQTPSPAAASPKTPAANATPSPRATSNTAAPVFTATATLTPEPTPLYALIAAHSGGGAFMRREPGGPVILTLENNELVQALSAPLEYDGVDWVQVKVVRGDQSFEGWIIQSVLKTATPSPEW